MSLSLFFQSATVSDGGKSQFLLSIFIAVLMFPDCECVLATESLGKGGSLARPGPWEGGWG